MLFKSLLIANRGEIAIRIAQAASDLGIATVAVAPADDANSLHLRRADTAVTLPGAGPAAYLDGKAIIRAALEAGCDAIHPGYGFLSENASFARQCADAGIVFIGPAPETLELFGDKGRARALARELGVPLAAGTETQTSLAEMASFMGAIDGRPAMIKAVAGGGGRGMRIVSSQADLADAATRAAAEALAAFGSDALYIEELITPARHIEVQVLGDATGDIVHLYDRECSLQRRSQKIVEIAPGVGLSPKLRDDIIAAALTLARAANVRTLCTFEFLVDLGATSDERFVFMEANPRVQVEHTVTEQITGVDLVRAQIETAAGRTLADLGLTQSQIPRPTGIAIQLRINMEHVLDDGTVRPASGTLTAFDPPFGPGIRLETLGYDGYVASARYDSLLAKLIVTSTGTLPDAFRRAYRALCGFRIEGVETNIPLLLGLMRDERVQTGAIDTRFIERCAGDLLAERSHPRHFAASAAASVVNSDRMEIPFGAAAISAPVTGILVSFEVAAGELVRAGATVAIVEAMKMQQAVTADRSGIVKALAVNVGASVEHGEALLIMEDADVDEDKRSDAVVENLDHVRPDLADLSALLLSLTDSARPSAVAARRKTGQRTARENIADLCDEGSFHEYGALALAAQRRRRSPEELQALSPADGLVTGVGTINAAEFGEEAGRAMVMSYDYTVFAGTQGFVNHKKMDRMFGLANQTKMPLVIFAEGGGGRPGETDHMGVAGLDMPTFRLLGQLSARAPSVAIVSGRCFAGNAAIAAGCDLIIATRNATLGMGGPAMIEGGGLGKFRPEEVGPVSVQEPNGVIDIVVDDEAAAVSATKQYLSFFQGSVQDWTNDDQRKLRHVVPQNRLRAYDVGEAIRLVADTGSLLEMRPRYGLAMRTLLGRVEGRPVGFLANDPRFLGGAIDGDAADKAARFMELCETYGLPIVSFCDTPGFMVGPEAEKTALVRRVGRMFLVAANCTVPVFTIVLRKGYGLGAMGMAAGSTLSPSFSVSWPTGEFGGMGLEGAVQLGYRNELAAITDPDQRKARYDELLNDLYQLGKATSMASFVEIDAVIDPAETRNWIRRGLFSFPTRPTGDVKRRPYVTPR